MIDDGIVKSLGRWELPALATVGSVIFLYFSFFASLPAPSNDWSPANRSEPAWWLFGTGLLLITLACAVVLAERIVSSRTASSRTRNLEKSEPMDSFDSSSSTDLPDDHPAVRAYFRLTGTQKEILLFRYEGCSTLLSIALDDFYEKFTTKHGPDLVGSADEMSLLSGGRVAKPLASCWERGT
jgi:hypothetical protein